jgi:hypothetical protein
MPAMPEGGKINGLYEKYRLRGSSRVRVTDTGCGMDEPTRLHVTEPCFTMKLCSKGKE